jgi:hypothetical protein
MVLVKLPTEDLEPSLVRELLIVGSGDVLQQWPCSVTSCPPVAFRVPVILNDVCLSSAADDEHVTVGAESFTFSTLALTLMSIFTLPENEKTNVAVVLP